MKFGNVSFNMEAAHGISEKEFYETVKGHISTDKKAEWEKFKKEASKYKPKKDTKVESIDPLKSE